MVFCMNLIETFQGATYFLFLLVAVAIGHGFTSENYDIQQPATELPPISQVIRMIYKHKYFTPK